MDMLVIEHIDRVIVVDEIKARDGPEQCQRNGQKDGREEQGRGDLAHRRSLTTDDTDDTDFEPLINADRRL